MRRESAATQLLALSSNPSPSSLLISLFSSLSLRSSSSKRAAWTAAHGVDPAEFRLQMRRESAAIQLLALSSPLSSSSLSLLLSLFFSLLSLLALFTLEVETNALAGERRPHRLQSRRVSAQNDARIHRNLKLHEPQPVRLPPSPFSSLQRLPLSFSRPCSLRPHRPRTRLNAMSRECHGT